MTDASIAIPVSVVLLIVTQIVVTYVKSRNGNVGKHDIKCIIDNQKRCMEYLDLLRQATVGQVDLVADIKELRRNATRQVDLLADIKELLSRSSR